MSEANRPAEERAEGDAARGRAEQSGSRGGEDEQVEGGTQEGAEEATDGGAAGRTVPAEERPEAGGV